MTYGKDKEPTLVELVEQLSLLTPDSQKINFNTLKKCYTNGMHLDKVLYRNELNSYITFYTTNPVKNYNP